jgi:endonuclease/exonuclease/phosphatase family metal-dependent hydrolase
MDHNEWLPWGPVLRWCNEKFGHRNAIKTFPSGFPVFALDRIWVRPARALVSVERYISQVSRIASDHLPIRARIDTGRL